MISYGKLTSAQYNALATPVQDRIYFLTDTGETILNGVPYKEDTKDYFHVIAEEDGCVVNMHCFSQWGQGEKPVPTMEWSYNRIEWFPYTWTDGEGRAINLASKGDVVWFRGNNTVFTDWMVTFYVWGIQTCNSKKYSVAGNIMSLLDKTMQKTEVPAGCFAMFLNPSQAVNPYIIHAGELKLPATTVGNWGYIRFAIDCPNLVDIPELPATTLGNGAYQMMFSGSSMVSRIKVAFTSWNESVYTSGWVYDVARYGVFECPATLPNEVSNNDRVPQGWAYNPPEDTTDYFCIEKTDGVANDGFRFLSINAPNQISLEYSYDRVTWTPVTIDLSSQDQWIALDNTHPRAYLRGDNETINCKSGFEDGYKQYVIQKGTDNAYKVTGNIMSLIDKTCKRDDVPDYCFAGLFYIVSQGSITLSLTSDSMISLPARRVGSNGYRFLFANQPNLMVAPEIAATEFGTYSCHAMFYNCQNLKSVPSVLRINDIQEYAFALMFNGCTSIVSTPCIIFDRDFAPVPNWGNSMFSGCSNLKCINVIGGFHFNGSGFDSWFGSGLTSSWVYGVSQDGTAIGHWIRYVGGFGSDTKPASWSMSFSTNYGGLETSNVIDTTASMYGLHTVFPNLDDTFIIKPYNNGIFITVAPVPSNQVAYSNVIIDYASGATPYPDTNSLTLVDSLVEGKRNHCVIRWCNGTAKLFVVDTEDIPA